ncbi:DUF2934 domain-containing protein [Rhizobium sp. Leaf262]|uniref:DUF2934 domain-containing protein n=1 Tax=Rhizobium sp. Leaf262 TaxID=1736312 RepID=UPI000715B8BD|nr:DUF2934 domain-containing protein [Rhizobium sp. Leaf262]KQO75848.1 hypothetical protein ASF29_11685 [Rhizobium sp. Leaf262]
MPVSENDWISKRAYTLWENEGRPHGRDSDHWEQAKHEYSLLQNSKATKPAHRKKADVKLALAAEAAKPKVRPRKAAAK